MDKDTLFSSFGKWVTPLNSVKFTQRIEEMKQDKYTKKLTTKAYLLLFLHAQLQQREGLSAIADDALLDDFQRELGLTSISAFTTFSKTSPSKTRITRRNLSGFSESNPSDVHEFLQSGEWLKNRGFYDHFTESEKISMGYFS